MIREFYGRVVLGGQITGGAVVTSEPVNLLESFQPNAIKNSKALIAADKSNKDLYKKNLTGKILCVPNMCGLTTGGLVLQTICAMKINPAAILYSKQIDTLSCGGLLLSRLWENSNIIVVDNLGDEFLEFAKTNDRIEIKQDGIVIVDEGEKIEEKKHLFKRLKK